MNLPFLSGQNIILRGLEASDADGDYVNWLNDPEVTRYNSHHVYPYNKNKALEYIEHSQNARDALILAVCLRENGLHIGNISLQNINFIDRSAEFAILMGNKDYWHKGHSREAALLLINHGFMEMNLHRIYCGTSKDNVGMQKLALSIGMKQEGQRREAMFKHGQFVDILEYGILKDEHDKLSS